MTEAALYEELRDVADELDTMDNRRVELWERRALLWDEGKRQGLSSAQLAGPSRVKPVTVRYGQGRSAQPAGR
jgi:hypothetical protein